jgi:dihydropyrimidine dehydrogenase (NAD+) subunit PreA
VAEIDQLKCIHCGLCYIACEDGAHQSIRWDRVPMAEFVKSNGHTPHRSGGVEVLPGAGDDIVNEFTIKQDVCVGCNMCSLVCPVQGCISMKEVDTGKPPMTWNQYQKLLAEGKVEKIRPPEHV